MEELKRIEALAKHLECDVEDLEASEYRDNCYAVNPRKEKQGEPPAYYVDIIAKFKTLLTPLKRKQIAKHIITDNHDASQQDKLYHTIKRYLHRYQTEKKVYEEIADKTLYVENMLYHLLSSEDKDFVKNYQNAFLGVPLEDKREYQHVDSGEYLILTDEEADKEATEYIESSLWAFNADFIVSHSILPYDAGTIELVQGYTEDKCEEANDTIRSLIHYFDRFVKDAISSDGRGHFIAQYDFEENTVKLDMDRPLSLEDNDFYEETLYIYRIN